jgi:hypothetical protein
MSAAETTFPRTWDWGEDGDRVEGTFVRFDEAPTRGYGYKPILILGVDGEDRTVWLFHDALLNKFREEVVRRQRGDLEAGERVEIVRAGDKVSESSGRTYTDYKVMFPDRPARSGAEILGARDKPAENSTAEKPDGEDDGLPF